MEKEMWEVKPEDSARGRKKSSCIIEMMEGWVVLTILSHEEGGVIYNMKHAKC